MSRISFIFTLEVASLEVLFYIRSCFTMIVNLHPTEGTHWDMFVNEFYFDSYGCPPPTNILSLIKKGIYSEYQIQTDDSYCAVYCLYVLYLTQIIGFNNAVLNLYYQTYKLNK